MTVPNFGTIQRAPQAPDRGGMDPLIRVLLANRDNERALAAHDLAKQQLALQIQKEKTTQIDKQREQGLETQRGEFAGAVMEALMQNGDLTSILRESGIIPPPKPLTRPGAPGQPPYAAGSATPAQGEISGLPPELQARIKSAIAKMTPEARASFVEHDLSALSGFPGQRGGGANGDEGRYVSVQIGSHVARFDKKTGLYENPDKPGDWVPSLKRGLSDDVLDRDKRTRISTLAHRFTKREDVKQLISRGPLLIQAAFTLDRALNSPDPAERKFLYSSAVVNLMQGADQKAQVRTMMLNYFSKLDKSLGGSWRTLRDKLLKGELPPDILGAMNTHMRNLAELSAAEYDRARVAWIKGHPDIQEGLDLEIGVGSEIFDEKTLIDGIVKREQGVTTPTGGVLPLPTLPTRPPTTP